MFSIVCRASGPIPPSTSFMVPGTMPIWPERYSVLPTRTASENGRVVGSTLPEFRYSMVCVSAADTAPAAATLPSIVSSNRISLIIPPWWLAIRHRSGHSHTGPASRPVTSP